jgi:hypothetical protein
MGHKAKRVKHLDSFFNIVLRVKGREKNEMIRYADKLDMSLSAFILYAVWVFILNEKGLPDPGSAQFAIPSPADELRSYLSGEMLLKPCGQRECDMKRVVVGGMEFCNTCNIRIG